MEVSSLKTAPSQPWPHDANFVVTVLENREIRGERFRLQPPWEIALWDVMLPPGKDDTFRHMGAPHLSKSHYITHVGVYK
jgi:hypothetical protein